jgi:hypothetical protein
VNAYKLILGKFNLRRKNKLRDKEDFMLKDTSHQEDIKILNICVLYNSTSKSMKKNPDVNYKRET